MKKEMWTVFAALVMASASTSATSATALAERHVKMGVNCEQCHQTKLPQEGAKVKNQTCLACHQSYDVLAKRTEKLNPNPHKTHLGNVRCSDCHSGHGQSRLMCNDCHKFDLKVK